MSQSPVEDFSESAVLRYKQGWQALNRLLHEDRSFSGHERHCAYLNTGGGPFANVSAVTGLDFPEDGRGVGVVDWDFDGNLDLWITNRTAPRVRFMLNQSETTNHFIAFHLQGDGKKTNRDAIGARVEVQLSRPLIKSKYGGENFLSQSSGWMHFGLGAQSEPVGVLVKWPNAAPERFDGLAVDGFYILRQGAGNAEPWTPPAPDAGGTLAAASGDMQLPPAQADARIVLPAGLPLPALTEIDVNGEEKPLSLGRGPVVVNAWASWCRPCLEELSAWSTAADRFQSAGLRVLALNADEDAEGRANSRDILERLAFPFEAAATTPKSVRALDLLQRAVLDRWQTMPVPCSFLVDAQGFVVAIYKGGVTADQLLEDQRLLQAGPEARRMAAVPFEGIWTHDPPTPDPMRVTAQFVDFAMVREGLAYLERATEMDRQFRSDLFSAADFADRYLVAAALFRSQAMQDEALEAYARASALNPSDSRVHRDLADYHLEQGRLPEAMKAWVEVLKINPGDLEVRERLASAYLKIGRPDDALILLDQLLRVRPRDAGLHFQRGLALQKSGDIGASLEALGTALKANPNHLLAANGIAWIQAAHPEAQWRNGPEALKLANMLCEKTKHQFSGFLMTLAAAQAETGQFTEAAATTEKALALLKQGKDSRMSSEERDANIERLEARLADLKAGRPIRDETL